MMWVSTIFDIYCHTVLTACAAKPKFNFFYNILKWLFQKNVLFNKRKVIVIEVIQF